MQARQCDPSESVRSFIIGKKSEKGPYLRSLPNWFVCSGTHFWQQHQFSYTSLLWRTSWLHFNKQSFFFFFTPRHSLFVSLNLSLSWAWCLTTFLSYTHTITESLPHIYTLCNKGRINPSLSLYFHISATLQNISGHKQYTLTAQIHKYTINFMIIA